MQWYKYFIADFQQDTADLTMIEQGAYRLLLEAYYQREGPLPADLNIIHRLCRAQHFREQQAISKVLQRYFKEDQGCWRNNRADEEIVKYQARCAANRRPNRPQIDRVDNKELQKPVDNPKTLKATETLNRLRANLHKRAVNH